MNDRMRIVFMGTPDFAVASLKELVEHGQQVVGVVTATDKYGGRGGKKLIESAVKKYAQEQQIKVLQPSNLKSEAFLQELKDLNADLQVVVAFRMLPEVVWNMPPLGTFNLHGSLLPKYRGAAPINWAIINGEQNTGVTTFFLKHAIDTGDIIFQESLPIAPNDTAGSLHDKMMHLGAKVVLKTVQAIANNTVQSLPQNDSEACDAPKIFKETCEINTKMDVQKAYDFVRGMSPYPAAWTTLDDKMFKIFDCNPVLAERQTSELFETDQKSYLRMWFTDGYLSLNEVQLQGKKRMQIKEFLNGYKFI